MRAEEFPVGANVSGGLRRKHITETFRHTSTEAASPAWIQVHDIASRVVGQPSIRYVPSTTDLLATNTLMHFKRSVSEKPTAKFEIQQLMLHAIAQPAIVAFEPTSLEIFAQDGYMINQCGQVQSKTFVYAEHIRYRVRHHTSSFRTALGCAWIRTTTLYSANHPDDSVPTSQTVTSVAIYPTSWLKWLGFRNGLEAVVASAGRSWLLNCRLTVTCAVPEDSLVFELCRTGQTRAVETLLAKGLASVVDTSPNGWKPLHVRTPSLDLLRPMDAHAHL